MQHRQINMLIDQVFATAVRIGAKVPKHLADEHQKIALLADASRRLEVPTDMPGAVLAALEAGNDPLTDEGVRNVVIGREIDLHTHGIAERLGVRAMTWVGDNVDELLAVFIKPFDTAAATLTQAAERLGDVDLDDMKAVLAKGGDAGHVWADAQEAEKTIASIQTIWKQIALFVPRVSLDSRWRLLMIADIEPAAYVDQELNTGSAHLRPFELIRRGHRLSLATPTTLLERKAAVQDLIQARTSHAEGAWKREIPAHTRHGGDRVTVHWGWTPSPVTTRPLQALVPLHTQSRGGA